MNKFEILAPAGAAEQLKAAVICGANAVYLGAGNFNARRNADNFTDENLKEAVDYCHLRKVKVYVTLNTLIFDKEFSELYETVKNIAKSGADAVIVQDFAVLRAVKEICPELPVHASTQMAVHNVSGAQLLENLGFSRIVLARELSLREIAQIRKNVKAELEVFVHGAHCMGTSGNCYLSAMLGERSGNRGLCAQGCRLNWKSTHGREYALSLKDMSYFESIDELCRIGVDSFKIEGRMKRPEYVAAAVTSLKNALNGKVYDKETLRSVFSRNGFTDGYLKEKRDLSMFGYRGKEDVTSAVNVLKNLKSLYNDEIHPTGIDMDLILEENKEAVLKISAEGYSVTVRGAIPEIPRNAPLPEEIARRNLSKLGDTPFTLKNLKFSNKSNLTISASSINSLRRDGIEELKKLLTDNQRTVNDCEPTLPLHYHPLQKTSTRVRVEKFTQYSDIMKDCEFIIVPLDEILKNPEKAGKLSKKIIVELPSLIYPFNENYIKEQLIEIKKSGITRGITGNIGGIKILKDANYTIHGSHGFNITNTSSVNFYKELNLKDLTLSFELTQNAMKNLGGDIPRGAYVYGYLPLMLLRSCPQKNYSGCENCKGVTALTDRKGIKFPLVCHNRIYSVLLNSVPLYIGDKNLTMLDFATLYFTIESPEECTAIYEAYKQKNTIPGAKTNGLFFRELL